MELQEYADLRNAIVHQRSDEGHIIAIPIDEVVAEIEELARKICEPPKVSAHFLKPVKICDPQTEIREAVDIMETMGSSKLPVYAQGGFHALLTCLLYTSLSLYHGSSMLFKHDNVLDISICY